MGRLALFERLFVNCRLARPFTLLAPALGVLSGAAMARGSGAISAAEGPLGLRLLSGCLAAALLTAASNLLNQICDLEIDRINHPRRPLPAGEISRIEVWAVCGVLYSVSLGLAWVAGRVPFLIALCVALMTVAYSVPPLRLRRFGWTAQTTIALSRGLLLPPFGWACVASIERSGEAWCLGLVFCGYLVGASATKDFGDQEGDRLGGCRSLPLRLGAHRAALRIRPFLILPWIALAGCAPLLSAQPATLAGCSVSLALYGAWSAARLVRDPLARNSAGRHPVWVHMYSLLLLAQASIALSYLLA